MRSVVTTIGSSDSPRGSSQKSIKNLLALVVTAVGVVLTSYFGYRLVTKSGVLGGEAQIQIETTVPEALVYLDGKEFGKTPTDTTKVKKGEHTVRIVQNDLSYETKLPATPSFVTVVKRDLGIDQFFSAGQNLWFEKKTSASVLSIISEPAEATVYIDGTEVGKTPYSTDKLTEGGFEVKIEKTGYEPQSAYLEIKKDYNLNFAAKLFPLPVPQSIKLMEGSLNIYDVPADNNLVLANPESWAKAVSYYNKTRGLNIMGYGINKEGVFEALIDFNGYVYTGGGEQKSPEDIKLSDGAKIGYLRRPSDGVGLSDAAKMSIEKLGKVAPAAKTATVASTPTGWLRMREEPSLAGAEIAKLDTGTKVTVMEEKSGWSKVSTSDNKTGWVSSDYLE